MSETLYAVCFWEHRLNSEEGHTKKEIGNQMAGRITRLISLLLQLSAAWGIWAQASARAEEKLKTMANKKNAPSPPPTCLLRTTAVCSCWNRFHGATQYWVSSFTSSLNINLLSCNCSLLLNLHWIVWNCAESSSLLWVPWSHWDVTIKLSPMQGTSTKVHESLNAH